MIISILITCGLLAPFILLILRWLYNVDKKQFAILEFVKHVREKYSFIEDDKRENKQYLLTLMTELDGLRTDVRLMQDDITRHYELLDDVKDRLSQEAK